MGGGGGKERGDTERGGKVRGGKERGRRGGEEGCVCVWIFFLSTPDAEHGASTSATWTALPLARFESSRGSSEWPPPSV